MDQFTTVVAERFRVTGDGSGAGLESRSGARVLRVRTDGGRDAYLKATPATRGPEAIAAARRELRFYEELAQLAPLRTPPLLDRLDSAQGVAVLLEARGSAMPAPQWTEAMWADLGRALAGLHDMAPPQGWARPDPLRAPDVDQAMAFWHRLLPHVALAELPTLREAMSAPPAVFVHGDCHTENITVADGGLIFCDWQSSGIGRPSADLAFLSVRATPSGVRIPPTLVDAYLERRSCDPKTLRRALLAEELAILVFLWPAFAALNGPQGVARVRERTRELAERWMAT